MGIGLYDYQEVKDEIRRKSTQWTHWRKMDQAPFRSQIGQSRQQTEIPDHHCRIRLSRRVCRCVGISSRQIIAAVRKHEAHDLESIQRETRAGTACETCHPEVVAILTELAGGALPAHQVAAPQA